MPLVAGIDSSTQSCKVVVCDADSGEVVRSGSAPHPPGTEVAPAAWLDAFAAAARAAGGLDDVAAASVGAQQHGMVCLDRTGSVVRDALLWNDTRSAAAAEQLIADLGGPDRWADAVGVVPVAAVTAAKLRWLADAEPAHADAAAAVCLPHDWLTWRLGGGGLDTLATDRSDASGTGYFSAATGEYRTDLLELALRGRRPALPRVLGPAESTPVTVDDGPLRRGTPLGAGAGDNAGAALGLDARPGDCIVSLGTSGVVSAVTATAPRDPSGVVAGFADATGHQLPLVCTLNGAPVLAATARMLGADLEEFARLALAAPAGAEGLVLVPFFAGERSPNLPNATGSLQGVTGTNLTRENIARAAVEGLLCSLQFCLDAIAEQGTAVERILVVGGGGRSGAVRDIAPAIFGRAVDFPADGEYVARGAARQAAWALRGDGPAPEWARPVAESRAAAPTPEVYARYREAAPLVLDRP
ncbi:xylulose kinase [Tsukamurella tyrosinosolvens]|uniref:FGGY family carbohydrate kinase n=1 Tax=Tsukamurella tyrosinosolvens TaxID=57704 RepID=UPI00079115B8|nr:FGGY family carbohydrate kinase [Tsukamurella tyrosinosolvens]KXP07989.1 xylulose kinase [Tsukamurella tyrosinosolvens]KZL97452.1 xylulose kinase [Tsukamurella tyrosinosolvens]MCA4995964.1 xylulose kinase [Tsukamurella tyrosinosolvens]WEL91733.1 FGGY family carbohydrate kinase [Tsukamurella tyrosinosolvens]